VFYLSAIHVLYFAFIHYTPSLLRAILGQPVIYPDNPLRFYYLAAFLSVLLVQIIAFIITVWQQRSSDW
jgi:sulfoxide reductase heme-binding subunit YedZ